VNAREIEEEVARLREELATMREYAEQAQRRAEVMAGSLDQLLGDLRHMREEAGAVQPNNQPLGLDQ
jgi:hypothetical protein